MERFNQKVIIFTFLSLFVFTEGFCWGFFAHKNINKLAVFTLPPEIIGFYKKNIDFITETAVLPDKRRYAVKEEAPRHFMDLDVYEDSNGIHVPYNWNDAVIKYTEDSLIRHGIIPWHLSVMKYRLTEAFKMRDTEKILKLSTEIGHYIADAHVPLHTCRNYNGQLSKQNGIHGLWESRLPELYFLQYDFFVGPAEYIPNTSKIFWETILSSHAAVDSVLLFEKRATEKFSQDKKYSFEERGGTMVKVYSKEFCEVYHKMLNGQVERRMQASVKVVGNIWLTCWVDAGQPRLNELEFTLSEEEQKAIENEKNQTSHETCNH